MPVFWKSALGRQTGNRYVALFSYVSGSRMRSLISNLSEQPLQSFLFTEDFGFCSRGDEAGPSLRCYSDERRRGPASPRGALKRGTVSWQGSPSPARASPGRLGKLRRVRGCLCVCFSLRGAC